MKILGSTKSKINNDRNKYLPHLQITEVILNHCNNLSNDYQKDSRVLYIFYPNKSFRQLLDILPKKYIFLNFFNSECSQTHFIFNSKSYNQIDGVAMGSPLAPVLTNIFMGFYESKWLNEYNLNKPKLYLRYVDDILAAFDKEQDSLDFFNFLNKRHPNIKFTIEKQKNHSIAFLDVFISGINNQNLILQTYHKSTYTGLLLNFKSFTSFSYKTSLIKCLLDRSFKICNNWNSFHNDIENIKSNLIKNAYPPSLIDKVIKKYLDYKCSSNQSQLKDTPDVHYFKLPYMGNLSHHVKKKLSKLCKEFCKENFNIKLVFNSFKIKNYFSYKDSIPDDLKSFLVYKFTCANCSSRYIGETCRHFKTRIEEHIKKDNKSHIFKHLHSTTTCFDSYNSLCFKIIDKANSKFDLKIKEALHINWRKPNLNAQQNHLALTLFTIAFSFPLTLISIIYCLNYTSLLLHLVTTHLLSHLFFIYCFHYLYGNYRHLLLS